MKKPAMIVFLTLSMCGLSSGQNINGQNIEYLISRLKFAPVGKLENELRTNWEDGYYFDFRCYGGKSFKDLEAFKKWAPGFQKKFAGETGWDREIPAGHEMLLRFWSLCRGLLQNGFIVRGRAYHLICYDALYRSASFIFYFEPAKDFEGWVFTNTFTAFP